MYLVDTNTLSELRRNSTQAVDWYATVPSETILLSVITVGEIYRGIIRKQSKDPGASAALNAWLQRLCQEYAGRLLPIDESVAREWGRVTAGRSRNAGDGLIAATAIAHKLTLVTRNVRDFADLPVGILNPWDLP